MSCTFGTTRVTSSQAAVLPSCSTLTGAELPQAKKKACMYVRRVASVVSDSLQTYRLVCQASLSGRDRLSPGKDTGAYWPILVAIPF